MKEKITPAQVAEAIKQKDPKQYYTKLDQDLIVSRYCKMHKLEVPKNNIYLGDLLFDTMTCELFFPFIDDLADIRRRSRSIIKVKNYDPRKKNILISHPEPLHETLYK